MADAAMATRSNGEITSQTFGEISRQAVRYELEQAGRTLVALKAGSGAFPQQHASTMPEPVHDFVTGYQGAVDVQAPMPRPSADEIDDLDRVLPWLFYIMRPVVRRVVFARSLVHPLSDGYIYSYGKLERTLGMNRDHLRDLHAHGLDQIVQGRLGLMRGER